LAIATALITGGGGDDVIHFLVGPGFILFALAILDFGLPYRWLNWVAAACAAAFGGIFLLQGIADVTHDATLYNIAFPVLGHEIERFMPEAIFIWFAALALVVSNGRSRWLGLAVMTLVFVLEASSLIGLATGIALPNVTLRFFIPFVWVAFESAKARPVQQVVESARQRVLANASAT
jgi:hypothetical protein